jgi:hypothetical protein
VHWLENRGPKVEAAGEPHSDDVERYESLRRRALGGETSGWRLGLAVVQRRGVAAWLRVGQAIAPQSPTRPAADVAVGGDELVGVLSTMALACIGRR